MFLQGGVESDVPVDEKGATYKNMQSNIAAAASGGGIVSNGMSNIIIRMQILNSIVFIPFRMLYPYFWISWI